MNPFPKGRKAGRLLVVARFEVEHCEDLPMSSRRSAPSAPVGPYEAQTSVVVIARAPALHEAEAFPPRDTGGLGQRKVPRPAIAELRLTSDMISNFNPSPGEP